MGSTKVDIPIEMENNECAVADTVVPNKQFHLSVNVEATARLRELLGVRKELEAQLDAEMSRRDVNAWGASEETKEYLKEQRDSTCLSLKSQIVDVDLQLIELKKNK